MPVHSSGGGGVGYIRALKAFRKPKRVSCATRIENTELKFLTSGDETLRRKEVSRIISQKRTAKKQERWGETS